jgi:hypothetical protein
MQEFRLARETAQPTEDQQFDQWVAYIQGKLDTRQFSFSENDKMRVYRVVLQVNQNVQIPVDKLTLQLKEAGWSEVNFQNGGTPYDGPFGLQANMYPNFGNHPLWGGPQYQPGGHPPLFQTPPRFVTLTLVWHILTPSTKSDVKGTEA